MVDKHQLNPDGVVVVRFRLPEEVQADTAHVVGAFNDWNADSHPMRREDGRFVADIPLKAGRAYRFRYLLDGHRWENDWAADEYVPNEFGGDDSVIDLTSAETASTDDTDSPAKAAKPAKATRAAAPKRQRTTTGARKQ